MLQFLLFAFCGITISLTHNIDIKVGPILKKRTAASYFGFSATGVVYETKNGKNRTWVAVGSPRANTTELDTGGNSFRSTGALYKCEINMNPSDCSDITGTLQITIKKLNPTDGWYGVTVAGGRLEDDRLMVCSHRPLVTFCSAIRGKRCADAMPGYCLTLVKEDGYSRGQLIQIYNDNAADFNGVGGNQVDMSYERSRFGETGIAALVGKDKKFYASAVGTNSWTGSIVESGSKKYSASKQKYSYGGYSLASGSFSKAGSSEFAIGAPRYNMTGAVFLHESFDADPKFTILGEQYGSYFGMAICAGDFDGDDISEIVIAAPYYADSLSLPNSGKVYVYSSKKNFSSPVRTYTAPEKQSRALFGRAVATAGDLDINGYNDLIIGSPYEGKGGVVYIYYGSSKGLSSVPVQTIKASDFPNDLKTFGWSVRGESDLDGNGYPDVVVGAYASDSIMILRTVPVVDVQIQYNLSSPTIDVSKKTCKITEPDSKKTIQTVCFDVEVGASYMDRARKMTKQIDLSFKLDADTLVEKTEKKRVRFEATRSPHLDIIHKVKKGEKTKIVVARAYLRVDLCPDCEDQINPYPDIQFKVTPVLLDRPKPSPPPTSGLPPPLEDYFQLPFSQDADVKNFTNTTIKVKRACSPCRPNLKIKNVGTTKIPVEARETLLKIEVSNNADQAFGVSLTVDFEPPLSARPCGKGVEKCLYYSSCTLQTDGSRLTCDLGNFRKKAEEYKINVNTTGASNTFGVYTVTMNVTSANKEDASLLGDNSLSLDLNVASEADIELLAEGSQTKYYGGTVRGQFSMTSQDQIGLPVNHKYFVKNRGPDRVPEVNITIEWPYQATSGKHLLYLLSITGNDKVRCYPQPGWVNPLASQFKDDSSRVRRSVEDDKDEASSAKAKRAVERKGSASRIVLDCANGTAMCISIPCTVSNIGKGDTIAIIMESRIWNGTLLEDYTDRDVEVVSRGRIDELTDYVKDMNTKNHKAKATSVFFPASPKTTKKDLEVWIIVVSAIAGVVLLIILIVVFKMCGFFNRSGTARYDQVPADT